MPITVIILTYNEELNLPFCLQSVQGWVERIFVVDSGSTDRTTEIARQFGAEVVTHPFTRHSSQWNWALKHLPLSTEWVLGLDADQQVTSELRDEILAIYSIRMNQYAGFYVNRRQIFCGKWIKHGGLYPKYLLKLFDRTRTVVDETDLVDHHFRVTGKVGKLSNDLIEDNKKDENITTWTEKHNRYATLQAEEEWLKSRKYPPHKFRFSDFFVPDARVQHMKNMWIRLPLFFRPILYFFYRYFLRGGFLDGKYGFLYHFFQALWYRMLIDVKIEEFKIQ